jgi:hypothetical protein
MDSNGSSASSSQTFELKDVVTSLTALTEVMQKMAIQFGVVEEKVSKLEKSNPAASHVHESRNGTAATHHSEDGWRDGGEFSPARPSNASSFSLAMNQDAGTKLERPKFVVKLCKAGLDGAKKEFIRDSDFLDYFDDFEHYISTWEHLPMNLDRHLKYPNKERIALLSLPTKYAQFLCSKLKVAFNTSLLGFKTPDQISTTVFWQDLNTADVRTRIGIKFEEEVSDHGACEILKRIKFNSQFGLIDAQAFVEFQHEFKKEIMRIQAGGSLVINKINQKDILISALPDKAYQKALLTKYGPEGTLVMPVEEFGIDLIFEEVEFRISTITKQGLRAVVNKSARDREASFHRTPTHGKAAVVHNLELEEIVEEQVNAAMAGDKKCKKTGIGKDGLLFCRWLGEKGTCCFEHPVSEMALKGKGVSKESPNPAWLNTGKKAFHMTKQSQDSFYDSFDHGGGEAENDFDDE